MNSRTGIDKSGFSPSEWLAAIIESSDDAIVGKMLDGTITSWNPSAERLFGYSQNEALGQNITLIIPPERLHEELDIISRIRAGQRIEHFETVRRHKSGRPLYISVTISPVRDENGIIVGASKIARELSDHWRSEELLRLASDATNMGRQSRRCLALV